jgi:DNA repair protein SbcD/Mre11
VNTAQLHEALSAAHHYTIQAELVSQLTKPRLPELGCSVGDPLDALTTYLDNRPDLKEIATAMIAAAEELMSGDGHTDMLPERLSQGILLDLESSSDSVIHPTQVPPDRSTVNSKADGQLTLL